MKSIQVIKLNLLFALLMLIITFVLFIGGLGVLLWFATLFDGSHASIFVQLSVILFYMFLWYGGISCCVLCYSNLGSFLTNKLDRECNLFDYLLSVGHLVSIIALLNCFFISYWKHDIFYPLLMLSSLFYSVGLGFLALSPQPNPPKR